MPVVIFTGATSFLGRNLVKKLLESGYRVYALVREDSANINKLPNEKSFIKIYGTLQNLDIIKDTVDKADIFIHFAWDGSGNEGRANTEIQQRNVEYAKKAMDIAQYLKCKMFIFPGSQAEYGPKFDEIHEDDQCMPLSPYGKAKLDFSRWAIVEAAKRQLQFIHLRIFSVYGYGDREGTLIDSCVHKMNQGGIIHLGPCTQQWNYLYINDFVEIVLKLLEKNCITGTYNIASKDPRVLREFGEEIYECSGKKGKYVFGEVATNPEGSPNLVPNIDKVLKIIGEMHFTEFGDGIIETMSRISREAGL